MISKRTRTRVRRAGKRLRRARRLLSSGRRRLRRGARGFRRSIDRRYLRPVKRDLDQARVAHSRRHKAIFGTPLRADLRAVATWRGESPRVALRNYVNHPVFWTYRTHPPLRYAPAAVAELDHWVDIIPERIASPNHHSSDRRTRRRVARPHVLEVEHWALLAGAKGDRWDRALVPRAADRVRVGSCAAVLTLSRGLVDHFRDFLPPDVWPKLDHLYPAVPSRPRREPPRNRPFTILVVANRRSDKGVPEALRAYAGLRERHGTGVRMLIVSNKWPREEHFPEGVALCRTHRMSADLKARVFGSADVMLMLCYTDSIANVPEACSYGVPTVATRIHHGDEYVRDGESGYLVDTPIFAYTSEYGTRWRSWPEFMTDLDRVRAAGELDVVVDEVTQRLEAMVAGDVDLRELRDGARRLHAERFSPEARNARLNAIYARLLGRAPDERKPPSPTLVYSARVAPETQRRTGPASG